MSNLTPRIQFAGQSLSIISVLNLRLAGVNRYAEDQKIARSYGGQTIKALDNKSVGHVTFSYTRMDGVRVQITWQHDAVAKTMTRLYRSWNKDGVLIPNNPRFDWMNRAYPDQALSVELSAQLNDFSDKQ